MKPGPRLLVLAGVFALGHSLAAATYYTAPGGSDGNPGTLVAPFATVQHGADALAPGDTLLVRGGTYSEAVTVHVSGSAAGGPVTLAAYPGETPVLDGAALTVPMANTGLFLLVDRHYVTVQGFELRNYKSATKNAVPVGIHVRGASDHIPLLGNKVHAIETNVTAAGGGNAHGIAVYGDSTAQPISDLVIDGNELSALKLGASESLVVNGNVDGFAITHNVVHDNDNIGIDCIGFEGTVADPGLDQARHGLVAANTVYNVNSYGNPAYGNNRSADGIYVDGGTQIVIERNVVHHCNIGVELASEHAGKVTSAIAVRDNFIYQNDIGGVFIGGYDSKRGSTQGCTITNNTLYHNDTLGQRNGEWLLQYAATGNTFQQNIVWAGTQSLLIGNPFTTTANNTVDWNLYFAPTGGAGAQWQWQNKTYIGFSAYQKGTGNDAHSLFAAPGLRDPDDGDLHLTPDSPARDAGDPTYAPTAGETDIDGSTRISGGRVDIGAHEVTGASSAPHPPFFAGEVALSDGVYYLALPISGNPFGYYAYLANPRYVYHFDLGYEYVFDAADGNAGVYLYDFASNTFFYTSPTLPFPYLYDFSLNAVLYYYGDPRQPDRYNTDGTRYFFNFATGQIISK